MTFHQPPPESAAVEPVRLLAIGGTGMHFARALRHNARTDDFESPKLEDLIEMVRRFDFDGVAFLFIVIGMDATDLEVGQGMLLAQRASKRNAFTIGVFVERMPSAEEALIPSDSRCVQPEASLLLLMGLVDGRVETLSCNSEDDVDALRWFYGTLRALGQEGVLILEPGWDLHDVVEVLDLPGACLTLLTRTVDVGGTAVTAVQEALADLESQGVELALAGGVLLIIWQGPPHRLTVQQASTMSHMLHGALGAGGQHLIVSARATPDPSWTVEIGACATLVVSRGSQHGAPKGWS